MKHILFGDISKAKTAILIKNSSFNKDKIIEKYINPIKQIPIDSFIGFNLKYQTNNKCNAEHAKDYLGVLLPEINKLGITTILVCDSTYFKYLTSNKKVDPFYGYVCPCTIKGFEHLQIILSINYNVLLYKPAMQEQINRSLTTLTNHIIGTYYDPGTDIIKSASYPSSVKEIKSHLQKLLQYKTLTCDIETKGLKFYSCGISTIAFAWNKHEGIAFAVDRGDNAIQVRELLKDFFTAYSGKLKFIYHDAGFDIKVLIYNLWMKHLADYPNMLTGIDMMTNNFDDTKLITYFATNNAVQNKLDLKSNSAEFTGNYAQDDEDIKDTERIPLPELLEYNLKDCLATWYVYEKNYPIMVKDKQKEIYTDLFKPSVKTLLHAELCGMPLNPNKVQIAKTKLMAIVDKHMTFFSNSPIIKDFHHNQLILKAEKYTKKAKKKVYTITDSVIAEDFNPNSDIQLQALLYDYLGYKVIDRTKSKAPATGAKTLKKLINHATCTEHKEILEHLIGLGEAAIILTTFIPAFEEAQQLPDGSYRLYGNFNLGGAQSLRLSSSSPNLQNIPSSSTYAKIIKECFEPPKGLLYLGSDFDSLEDKTNALITKDPNKVKVYTDGYDGHCLRAHAYWGDQMPDILDSVESINTISEKYKTFRQDSKAPTFALTYKGTYITLMNNCGFSEEQAKQIENRYHELYVVADAYIENLLEEAKICGYVPLAFGGRLRTPLLARSVGTGRTVPFTVKAEERSAGNAITQSYCALTLRAMNEFTERIRKSPYKYDIFPSATIHDAIYSLVKDDANAVKWINDNLIDCMSWQELPELKHPIIRISSGLEIYWPSWANTIKIPNNASKEEIKQICKRAKVDQFNV